jgi:hypothetical protein
MFRCPRAKACQFYTDQMEGMVALPELFKIKYCNGDFSLCARYLVCQVLGTSAVPFDLLPYEKEKAEQIIMTV